MKNIEKNLRHFLSISICRFYIERGIPVPDEWSMFLL
jgi:hypothetical protein